MDSSQTGAEVSTGVPGRAAKYAPDLCKINRSSTNTQHYLHTCEARGHGGRVEKHVQTRWKQSVPPRVSEKQCLHFVEPGLEH